MMLVLISMTPLFSHPLEVICTDCINLMIQPDQEVFFSIRAINHWNKLPDNVATAQTLNWS